MTKIRRGLQDQVPNFCILFWTLYCMLVVSRPHYGCNSLQPRCKYHRLKSSHVYNGLITLIFFLFIEYPPDAKCFAGKRQDKAAA